MPSENVKPNKNVILLVGPTAVGKTAVAVQIAQKFGAEIASCDSRQFYKQMAIGTAKPTLAEQSGVPHHFIDFLDVWDYYSAGDFARDLNTFLPEYFEKNQTLVITGGSGLFVKAFTHGMSELPETDLDLREKLMTRLAENGIDELKSELKILDPAFFEGSEKDNTQRIIRALEVSLSTGKPFSSFNTVQNFANNYNLIKLGLDLPRAELYSRINHRVDLMMKSGLLNEVESLIPYRNLNALKTVGYKEIFAYLDQELDLNTAIEKIKQNTRNYAKRQLTWFRNQDTFEWFNPNNLLEINLFIEKKLEN